MTAAIAASAVSCGASAWSGSEDSHFRAVEDGYVSVTPLHPDLTARDRLDDSERWWRPLCSGRTAGPGGVGHSRRLA